MKPEKYQTVECSNEKGEHSPEKKPTVVSCPELLPEKKLMAVSSNVTVENSTVMSLE